VNTVLADDETKAAHKHNIVIQASATASTQARFHYHCYQQNNTVNLTAASINNV